MSKRGSGASGRGGKVSGTDRQNQLMKRMPEVLKKYSQYKEVIGPKFTKNKDGSISYEYTTVQNFVDAHVGKFIDPKKNGIIERTTIESGVIMPDGLRIKNKPQKTEKVIKRRR